MSNGFDIELNFKNNQKDTASIGELFIGNFKLSQKVFYRNTNYTFYEDSLLSKNNIQYASSSRVYPSTSCYSPITVLRDNNYIVGVSLTYPIEEYKHTANHMFFGNFSDSNNYGWNMVIQINKSTNGQLYRSSGELPPRQNRIYKLHIRVTKVRNIDEDWKKVIQPYKNYFDIKYRQIYKLNKNPIIGYVGVNETKITTENPYGYTNTEHDKNLISHPLRPDIYGFLPTVNYIKSLAEQKNAYRIMIWAPSGLYRKNQTLNYPYQFATNLFKISKSKSLHSRRSQDRSPIKNFKKLSKEIDEMGMWWGHSGQISYSWDDGILKPFDVNSKRDWKAAFAELDAATSLGVNCLGLDSFNEMDGWDQILWLIEMNKRAQHKIKFVSELYSFDIVHTYAAFMYADWNSKSKHYLADYLIPNNEKWMLISSSSIKNINEYIQHVKRDNYVPCLISYLKDNDIKL